MLLVLAVRFQVQLYQKDWNCAHLAESSNTIIPALKHCCTAIIAAAVSLMAIWLLVAVLVLYHVKSDEVTSWIVNRVDYVSRITNHKQVDKIYVLYCSTKFVLEPAVECSTLVLEKILTVLDTSVPRWVANATIVEPWPIRNRVEMPVTTIETQSLTTKPMIFFRDMPSNRHHLTPTCRA